MLVSMKVGGPFQAATSFDSFVAGREKRPTGSEFLDDLWNREEELARNLGWRR